MLLFKVDGQPEGCIRRLLSGGQNQETLAERTRVVVVGWFRRRTALRDGWGPGMILVMVAVGVRIRARLSGAGIQHLTMVQCRDCKVRKKGKGKQQGHSPFSVSLSRQPAHRKHIKW